MKKPDERIPKKHVRGVAALKALLREHLALEPDVRIDIYCFNLDGLRIAEISFSLPGSGSSWMRVDPPAFEVILAAEDFVIAHQTTGKKGWPPEYVEEARDRLLWILKSEKHQ